MIAAAYPCFTSPSRRTKITWKGGHLL